MPMHAGQINEIAGCLQSYDLTEARRSRFENADVIVIRFFGERPVTRGLQSARTIPLRRAQSLR